MDALYHHEWAASIIESGWLGKVSFFRAPLYPYFLALLYKIFGINLLVPRIAQSIIGSFNCVLTSLIGTKLFKKRVGIISGFIAGAYPLFIYFDNELLIPTLLIFLVLLGFYLLLKQIPAKPSKPALYLNGIIWGLAAITRPNVLLFLVILIFWLIKRFKNNTKTVILYGLLGVMTTILPVTIRNYLVDKEFVLIAWQGGTNFYIGNNRNSDGFTAIIPGTRKTWWGGFHDAKNIAEQALKRKLTNSEIDKYWLSQGIDFIKKEPFKAFYLYVKKTYLFFSGFEISNNRDIYFFAQLTYLKFLLFNSRFFQFPFGLLFPLSLLGIFFFIKQRKTDKNIKKKSNNILLTIIFIISYSVSFIIFFICARYRLVIIPFLIIWACYAVLFISDTIRKRKHKSLFTPSLLFVGFYVFFNANIFNITQSNPALNYLTLGVAYKQNGKTKKALDCYTKAINIDPNQPEGYYNMGNIYAQHKNFEAAKQLYLKAIAVDPKSARAYNNLGNIYFETGEFAAALKYYNIAHTLEPDYETPLYHAGLIYKSQGDLAKAESLWLEVLRINPNNKLVKNALGAIRQSK
jgi:tetratricopeptide (TPR) repeat protein